MRSQVDRPTATKLLQKLSGQERCETGRDRRTEIQTSDDRKWGKTAKIEERMLHLQGEPLRRMFPQQLGPRHEAEKARRIATNSKKLNTKPIEVND